MDEYLSTSLCEKFMKLRRSYKPCEILELTRDIKESMCYMSDVPISDNDPRLHNFPRTQFELPDGTLIDLCGERVLVPELLCHVVPTLLVCTANKDSEGPYDFSLPILRDDSVPAIITDSVLKCDSESQSLLFSNIIFSGGGSNFQGLPERIRSDVESIVHRTAPGWRVKSISSGNNERALNAWIGGSILASLGSFHDIWISSKEYEEFGSSIIGRKCP